MVYSYIILSHLERKSTLTYKTVYGDIVRALLIKLTIINPHVNTKERLVILISLVFKSLSIVIVLPNSKMKYVRSMKLIKNRQQP